MRTLCLTMCAALCVSLPASAEPIAPAAYQALHWRSIGPFRGGRTRALAGVVQQPHVFYMAPVNGGVWKSDDDGRTWRPIFDDQPTQSIGAIAVAPSDPRILYVGSGEGLHRPDLSVGDGIYKSTDAGKTWTHLGLRDAQQVPQIVVDPKNPDRVYAAVLGHPYGPNEQRGVFRSLDGGATWTRVLYKDANTGASDLEIDPLHPNILYAALWEARLGPSEDGNGFAGTGGGLYKSIDGGTTWRQLTTGLPANTVQLDLAIAPSRPSRLYVTLTTSDPGDYASGKGNGVFRSDDAGASWTRITSDERPAMKIGGGDLMVPVVDPRNPDVVYVASIVAMKSSDGGKTWSWLRGAPGGDDYQNLWISPNDPNTILLVSDQGAVITVNGGRTWSSWYNQPTAQLYHVGVTAEFPYRVCSGQQESGSVCIASRGNDGTIGHREWKPVGIIEYGTAAPDPRNPDVIYGAGRTQVSRYQWSTGQVQDVTPIPIRGSYRAERTQPLMFSPLRPNALYYAANVLFESLDGGQRWRAISPDLAHPRPGVPPSIGALAAKNPEAADQRGAIYALALSFVSPSTIWAGTDDGKLWTTRDGGAHWSDITPPQLAPWSKVTQLEASHFDDATLYASVSRLRVDDLAPYLYKTHDRGKTWTVISGGLPPGPVNAVREDPVRRGLLYASTETAVWVSFDEGASWQSLQANLPHTSVRDLVVHGADLIIATHGRGFWIMDDITPLRQVAGLSDTLFKPAPAYRAQRSAYPDTPVPDDEPHAANPPAGAVIDYVLAQPADRVTLEISDARGAPIRRYASDDPPELRDDEIAHQLIPAWWLRPYAPLAITAGGHRWIWDLRGERPLVDSYEYPISAVPYDTPRVPEGPRVAPGVYTVKLT
ncbi:MAG: glycoside hydrolase, partial [Kofleriaceae bacterium]